MSDQVESPQGSEKFDHLFALMEKVAEKVDTLEAKQQQAAVKEKPLKSTRLDVQVQLNAEWINRLNQLAAEVGENQSLSALIEDMKARNMLLRKGDAQPSFFKFFEDRQSAHPEMSLAQCVQEALDKFTEIEAARPAQLPSATRKRPFPVSGYGTWECRSVFDCSAAAEVEPARPSRSTTGTTRLQAWQHKSSSCSSKRSMLSEVMELRNSLQGGPRSQCVTTAKVTDTWPSSVRKEQAQVGSEDPLSAAANSVVGKLKSCVSFWERLHSPGWVLDVILRGYALPFKANGEVPTFYKSNAHMNARDQEFVRNEIEALLAAGAISASPAKPRVVSPMAVVHNGSKPRLIIDLSWLNGFLEQKSVTFERLENVAAMLPKGGFLASFDMKSGYHHVEIREAHRQFLGIEWRGKFFVFNVLPFGLSSAPMLFTKLFRPLLAKWREAGITCALYLDDGLIFAPTDSLCADYVRVVRQDLALAGVVTSEAKCQWRPVQRLTWLGFEIDLAKYIVQISQKRMHKLLCRVSDMLQTQSPSKQERMQLGGSLASIGFVFGPVTSLKGRSLHATLAAMEELPAKARQPLSASESSDLRWWLANAQQRNCRSLETVGTSRRLATDASGTGAGAVLWHTNGSTVRTARNFEPGERGESSTYREVAAVLFALRAFSNELKGAKILVQVDNQGAVSIVKKGSSLSKLQKLAESIFDWAESVGSEVVPVWVPREENSLADEASRLLDRDDWGIQPDVFNLCAQRWGQPSLDAFANSRNAQCRRFLSRYAEVGAEAVDAFASSWANEFVWAVPPPRLIPDVVAHMVRNGSRAILGIPYWPSNLFFPSVRTGLTWQWFVKDVIWFEQGSELFIPSTYENSVFNSPRSPFPFCFLLVDCAL